MNEVSVRPVAPLRALALKSAPTAAFASVGCLSAVLVGSPWPILCGLIACVLWVLIGPLVPPVRRHLLALHRARLDRDRVVAEQATLRNVSEEDRRRFLALDTVRRDIHRLASSNPNLALGMVAEELEKLDALVTGFLDLSSQSARQETAIRATDLSVLDASIERQRGVVAKSQAVEVRSLAEQNLVLLERRRETALELRRQASAVRGELDLIENAVRLLREDVATLTSHGALREQLDALMQSMDAILTSARETEALVRPETALLDGRER